MTPEDRKKRPIGNKIGGYRKSYDFIGKKFGKLSVITKLTKRYVSPQGKKHVRWLCVCDCGNKAIVTTNNLSLSKTRSCGCLLPSKESYRERAAAMANKDTGYKELMGSYRRNAIKRGLEFKLSLSECKRLMLQDCHYCGQEPEMVFRKSYYPVIYNGIDRKDNSRGYSWSNVVTACKSCNRLKWILSYDDFIQKITDIYNLRVKNETR